MLTVHRLRRSVTIAVMALSIALAVATAAPAAHAQGGSIQLVAQTTVLRPGGNFTADARIAGAAGLSTLEANVYDRITSRIAFERSLDADADLGRPTYTQPAELLSTLRAANTGLVSIRIDTHVAGAEPNDPSASALVSDRAGVYPIELILRDPEGNQIDRVVSHLIVAPRELEPDTFPFVVGLYIELPAPLSLKPDQTRTIDPNAVRRTAIIAEAIANEPRTKATLVPSPEFMVALAASESDDSATTLELMQRAAQGREVLNSPYVSVSEEAWRLGDLTDRYRFLLDRGRAALTDTLNLATEPITSVRRVEQTDSDRTLITLDAFGIRRFVISPEHVSPLDIDTFAVTLSEPFELTSSNNRRLGRAVELDPQLHAHFDRSADAVLSAHQLLADLTVLALDRPGLEHGVVLSPPVDWQPSTEFLTVLFNGLARSPQLESTTISTYFDSISPAAADGGADDETARLRRTMTTNPADAVSVGNYRADIFATTAALRSYEAVVSPSDAIAPFDELLLVSASEELDDDGRGEYFTAVEDHVRGLRNAVIGPDPQVISITARDFDIPISVTNTLESPVNAVLLLESDKLEFPGGNLIERRLVPGINRFDIPVHAKTSGDSVLQVTVRSPDRSLQLAAPARITVRSTVFSGLGLIIGIGALVVLLTWWARQVWANHQSGPRSARESPAV